MKICQYKPCNKSFEPKRTNNTKFCSKKCKNKFYVDKRRRTIKAMVVEYLGGKCQRCGWAEHQAGLVPHHIDPSTKEFGVGQDGHSRSWERTRLEADKCVLLCANCHAVVHATLDAEYLILR